MSLRFGAVADIRVKFCDFTALAAFAAHGGAESAVSLQWVDWALTEATQAALKRKALAAAVNNAHDRARLIAHASGVGDVSPVEVADPGLLRGAGPWDSSIEDVSLSRPLASASSVGADALDLAPEDIEITATLHVRFVTEP